MAFYTSLLLLLLAYCLVPTIAIARTFDELQEDANRGLSAGSRGLVSMEQKLISSSAGTGHARSHETGLEESIVHGTEHEENIMRTQDFLLRESELLSNNGDTIPSLLDQNGLPVGLLPSSVASYSITDDGDFIVTLQKECYVKFDYEVYYATTITGKISYGTITDLSGIQAKEAFFWVPVTGIRTDIPSSKFIYFNVGPLSKKLSISQFETIPVCKTKAMALSAVE